MCKINRYVRYTGLVSIVVFTAAVCLLGCPGDDDSSPSPDAQTSDALTSDALNPGELVGWWVMELADGGGSVFGLAEAALTGGDGIQWDFTLADQRSAVLAANGTSGPELTGEWTLDSAAPTSIRVTRLDAVAGTLSVTADGEPLGELHPVTPFAQSDVGVFQRVSDGATIIFAHDLGLGGTTGVLSVLDSSGYWPEDYRYKGYLWNEDDVVLTDTFMTAARFDAGERIYACLHDWDTDADGCGVLERQADEPLHTELGGVWLGKAKRYDDLPEWFYAVVVGYNGTLYSHERDESFLDSLFEPQLRAAWNDTTGEYVDVDDETSVGVDWHAQPSDDGNWLFGEYDDGDPDTREFHSLQRIVQPPSGYLTGDASSISADWFDAPTGVPEPVLGNATIEQSGDQLSITDHSDDGETYQVDAQWTGYQYEGVWYNVATPDQTSPWRGQLIADGWYVHGTWENGEYSFSGLPILSSADAPNGPATGIVAADVYNPDLAYFTDDTGDTVVVVQRNQSRFTKVRVVTAAAGEAVISLDEQARPVFIEIVDTGVTYTLTWHAGTSTADVVLDDPVNGTSTSTLDLDLTQAAIQSRIATMESAHGVDLSTLSDWVQANPDRMADIYKGTAAPLSARIYDPELSASGVLQKNWSDDHWSSNNDTFLSGVGMTVITIAWAADSLLPMAFVGFGSGLALGFAAGLLVINLVNYLVLGCSTCSLICFLGCV